MTEKNTSASEEAPSFDESTLRSLELIDFNAHDVDIHIVGMGAVGGRVYEQLVLLGATRIHCYDFDEVEQHNLQNQLFTWDDIGSSKLEGSKIWAEYKLGTDKLPFKFISGRVTEDDVAAMSGIVISCVDSFDARRDLMRGCVKSGKVAQFLEGRCAPTFSEIRNINPFSEEQVEKFMNSLGDDSTPNPYVSICGMPISFGPVMALCGISMAIEAVNFLNQGAPVDGLRKIRIMSEPLFLASRMEL